MKWLVLIAALAGHLGLAGPAAAQTLVDRAYPWAKLDAFWRGTLGSAPPEAARFALLAPGDAAAEPVRAEPVPDFGLPFSGDILGESAPAGGAASTRAFPVIPLSSEDGAVLMRRLAWAEIYLSRYRFYAPFSTDGADVAAALAERQYAAGLEAYLITARLYFAAPDLPGKCRHLTRLEALWGSALSGLEADRPPAEWRALVPIAQATEARLGASALAALVCGVEPVRGRGETIRLVETRVREGIMQQARAKVTDTLTLLEAASAEFQALVNAMNVLIRSAEILELERVFGNAASNLLLVREDQLRAAETIATLQAVDLGSLNQPTSLQEFAEGQSRLARMAAAIEAVMAALADLPGAAGDAQTAAELAPCAALRGAYGALDLTRDTGTLTRQIAQPYEDCLARARTVVARFQQPSLEKAQMAALAAHVRQLSETYLATVAP